MTTMTVSQARASLPAVLDRVLAGEEVTITRHGEPVAVVVHPDVVRSRRTERAYADAARLHALLERAGRNPQDRPSRPGMSIERAEELVAEIRADRDAS